MFQLIIYSVRKSVRLGGVLHESTIVLDDVTMLLTTLLMCWLFRNEVANAVSITGEEIVYLIVVHCYLSFLVSFLDEYISLRHFHKVFLRRFLITGV